MEDFRDIEVKAGNHSFFITIAIGLLSLLILLISFSFTEKTPEIQPIEIAMNFGETDLGKGDEEPAPQPEKSSASPSSSPSVAQPVESNPTPVQPKEQPQKRAVTQNTTEDRPTASNQKSTSEKKKNSNQSKDSNQNIS